MPATEVPSPPFPDGSLMSFVPATPSWSPSGSTAQPLPLEAHLPACSQPCSLPQPGSLLTVHSLVSGQVIVEVTSGGAPHPGSLQFLPVVGEATPSEQEPGQHWGEGSVGTSLSDPGAPAASLPKSPCKCGGGGSPFLQRGNRRSDLPHRLQTGTLGLSPHLVSLQRPAFPAHQEPPGRALTETGGAPVPASRPSRSSLPARKATPLLLARRMEAPNGSAFSSAAQPGSRPTGPVTRRASLQSPRLRCSLGLPPGQWAERHLRPGPVTPSTCPAAQWRRQLLRRGTRCAGFSGTSELCRRASASEQLGTSIRSPELARRPVRALLLLRVKS